MLQVIKHRRWECLESDLGNSDKLCTFNLNPINELHVPRQGDSSGTSDSVKLNQQLSTVACSCVRFDFETERACCGSKWALGYACCLLV